MKMTIDFEGKKSIKDKILLFIINTIIYFMPDKIKIRLLRDIKDEEII